MSAPIIRIGLVNPTGGMPVVAEERGLPVLVSANALFNHSRKAFRPVPYNLCNLDVALDSAGFVALARYKRYPWSVEQYVEMALMGGFTWWSQMDCCCEPEIAGDRATVTARVRATAQMLDLCRAEYFRLLGLAPEFAPFSTEPMPIVQGWTPDDYRQSADLTDVVLKGQWPAMVGVGSVCRRNLNGPDGLWRVLDALDRALPAGVRVHLFGVKGSAIASFADHPRVASVDSMAFEFRARVVARERGVSKTIALRAEVLDHWLARQAHHSAVGASQLMLEGAA